MKRKVFVALSGGVDSSVAAWLLTRQGYDVTGVFMRCWSGKGPSAKLGASPSAKLGASPSAKLGASPSAKLGASCADRDAEDARRVAAHLSIPFYVWDFEEEYKRRVVQYMIRGYREGVTPNPDVMCNKEVKFGLFLEKALRMGADYVATGHYVKKENSRLYAAKDETKDQSYFLWTLTQSQLRHCLFPVGDYLKSEVRTMAHEAGLPTAEKKDSQGICFLGKVTLKEFLQVYIPEEKGDVLDVEGKKIGEHAGAHFYTIGQRHLGRRVFVPNSRNNQKPFYVAEKDTKANTVTVVEGSDHPILYRQKIVLTDVNFVDRRLSPATSNLSVLVRIRYRQPLVRAKLSETEEGWILVFETPVKSVASGQSAVMYRPSPEGTRELLGGGVISCYLRPAPIY